MRVCGRARACVCVCARQPAPSHAGGSSRQVGSGRKAKRSACVERGRTHGLVFEVVWRHSWM